MTDFQTRKTGGVSRRLRAAALATLLLLGIVWLNRPITFAGAVHSNGQAATLTSQKTAQTAQLAKTSVSDVAAKANPAVVTITNLQPAQDPFGNGRQSTKPVPYAKGSGYIIDTQGHVVTNNHVVEGGTAFQVEFFDTTTVAATLVGSDPFQDVAVLKLELKSGQTVPGTVAFGDSSKVRAGDPVVAIGSPYGEFINTVTDGTVGAVNRSLDTGAGFRLPNLIQHDAPIHEGNSGGPLLNMQGEVIGMNTAAATNSSLGSQQATGIGFAVASNAIKDLVQQIVDHGTVNRPYLGIRSQPLANGQGVVSVEQNGPAATAGLRRGDVITALNGQQVDDQHPFLNQLIFGHKPGDKVQLTVQRGGQEQSVEVTLGQRPAPTQ